MNESSPNLESSLFLRSAVQTQIPMHVVLYESVSAEVHSSNAARKQRVLLGIVFSETVKGTPKCMHWNIAHVAFLTSINIFINFHSQGTRCMVCDNFIQNSPVELEQPNGIAKYFCSTRCLTRHQRKLIKLEKSGLCSS